MKLQVRVHPAGGVALLLACLFLPSGVLLAAGATLLLHEGGHVLAMKLCGVRECRLELTPFGGLADVPDFDGLSGWKQTWIAAAGVGASALTALCCLPFVSTFSCLLFRMNVCMALTNCMPVWPLDGARILCGIARRIGKETAIRKWMLALAYLLAAALLATGVYGTFHGSVNPSLFLLPPYLCYAAWRSGFEGGARGVKTLAGEESLSPGKLKKANVYVCYGKPEKLETLRLLRSLPENRTVALLRFSQEEPETVETLSLQGMSRLLLERDGED